VLEGRSYDELWEAEVGPRRRSGLGLRFLYEALGDAGLAWFARRAQGRDFREYLAGWSRAGFLKESLAVFARAVWPAPESCPHTLPEHWCRAREGREAPPQGPVREIAASPAGLRPR
jgi:hypothetical protein